MFLAAHDARTDRLQPGVATMLDAIISLTELRDGTRASRTRWADCRMA